MQGQPPLGLLLMQQEPNEGTKITVLYKNYLYLVFVIVLMFIKNDTHIILSILLYSFRLFDQQPQPGPQVRTQEDRPTSAPQTPSEASTGRTTRSGRVTGSSSSVELSTTGGPPPAVKQMYTTVVQQR